MLCNNRNRKWVLRHFLPFHQVVQSLHGGRHLGTTGTTRLKTNAIYYLWKYLIAYVHLFVELIQKHNGNFIKYEHSDDAVDSFIKIRKRVKIRNRCNQAPHLTQYITHISLVSFLWDIEKQCRTRSDTALPQKFGINVLIRKPLDEGLKIS